jgi:hypothetical protein
LWFSVLLTSIPARRMSVSTADGRTVTYDLHPSHGPTVSSRWFDWSRGVEEIRRPSTAGGRFAVQTWE